MEDKRNIGLVTWFDTPNYGTNLQAYALYKALESRGYNVQLIRRFKTPFTAKNIKDNFVYAHGIRRFWKYDRPLFPEKLRSIRRFCRTELQVRNIYTARDLERLLRDTGLFIAGSDQLWNCHDHFRGFEFLDFAVGKRKVSYATSIGTAAIPAEYHEKIREYLSDFQYISLREQSGASSISALTGRTDIATVLDPVLLQDKAFWEAEAAARSGVSEGYVLYYILKKNAVLPSGLETASPLPAVIIPSGENPDFTLPGARIISDAGIREFIALVRRAALVVTDSFHGTALSIALERQFINLKRFDDNDIASQNIRLKDLLERLGIADRTWRGTPLDPIDYDAVRPTLAMLRSESGHYLDKALQDAD